MQRSLKILLCAVCLGTASCAQGFGPVPEEETRASDSGRLEASRVFEGDDEGEDEDEEDEGETGEQAEDGNLSNGGDDVDQDRRDGQETSRGQSEDDDTLDAASASDDDPETDEDASPRDASRPDVRPSRDATAPVQGAPTPAGGAIGAVALPPTDAAFDYQLGGDYLLPSGVRIVARDHTGSAAPGAYNVCYINGLQTQPDEQEEWLALYPELLLTDRSGGIVTDPEWPDEILLDIRTRAKREALLQVEADWIADCKRKGFAAIELDNLDSYTRSGGLIDSEQAVAFVRMLSDTAHAAGLAVAQKNAAELAPRKQELGTDFAVAEECNLYEECDAYTAVYGAHVLVVEYTDSAFETGCLEHPELSIVLRDVELLTPDEPDYVRDGC